MAYSLQQLSDFEDIRTLKHRYFRAIDTADHDLLETLFAKDVTLDFRGGTYRLLASGIDDAMLILKNAFHSRSLAMHHGHQPEITLTGDDTAKGIWYMEDIFINLETRERTVGSAIYRDRYCREDSGWKIAQSGYERVIELVTPWEDDSCIKAHYLAITGLKPEERTDITHLLEFF